MSVELIINMKENGSDIAILEDKKLIELHKESKSTEYKVGDIYLGKVRKVLPSLNAAFVNVGYEKDAFLHYHDLGPQHATLKDYLRKAQGKKINTSNLSKFKCLPDIDKNGKIKDQLSGGMHALVQVVKEPISSKGPRLTSEITLAGRYVVLVPFSNKISISTRITDEEDRKRLKNLMRSIKPPNCGIILRTVATGKKVAELHADLNELVERWELLLQNLRNNSSPPMKVLGELDRKSTVLRDLLTPDHEAIYINDRDTALEIKSYIKNISPEKEGIVKVSKSADLFEKYGVHKQIKASFGKQVMLKSGAYLIIEHTEAMHVIDVNSGNRKGGVKNQEENALKTNLECAEEIARILKLRDMGGIICVDFIDMQKRENQKKLFESFKEFMKNDKAKHNILPPSRFGVVEITRQRVRPVTDITTSEKCPSCKGTGKVEASVLFTDEMERELVRIENEKQHSEIHLLVHPMVEAYLKKGWFNSILKKWKKKFSFKLTLESSSNLELLEIHYYNQNQEEVTPK